MGSLENYNYFDFRRFLGLRSISGVRSQGLKLGEGSAVVS